MSSPEYPTQGDDNVDSSAASDSDLPVRLPPHKNHRMSIISAKYDVGNKGFLTEAEQRMRDMDTSNRGLLTNEQVAEVMEQTLALKEMNRRLRRSVMSLFVVVIVLGLSTMATAFVAARLAKDTSVNSSTGIMTVKGDSSKEVVTIGTGKVFALEVHMDESGNAYVCLDFYLSAQIFKDTMEGRRNSFMLESDEELNSVALTASGSFVNTTHKCFASENGQHICAEHAANSACEQHIAIDDNSRRSLLRNLAPEERRQKFRHLIKHGRQQQEERSLSCYPWSGNCDHDSGNSREIPKIPEIFFIPPGL